MALLTQKKNNIQTQLKTMPTEKRSFPGGNDALHTLTKHLHYTHNDNVYYLHVNVTKSVFSLSSYV